MTFKLITGLLALAFFFGAFSTWIVEATQTKTTRNNHS